jgi:hypothetical protein
MQVSEVGQVLQFTWSMITGVRVHPPPEPDSVCEALAAAGFRYRPSQLTLERHDERWLVRLPDQRLAWLAASANGLERLRIERRVLRLLEQHCTFDAPRVLYESPDETLDVRSMVPGAADPWRFYAEVRGNADLATRFGAAIGALLAQQHTRIGAADTAAWLPRAPSWPESRDWIRERIPTVIYDTRLIARIEAVMDAYESVSIDDADRVLVHADVGFHNLAIESESHTVRGIFDYEGAAWADRHHDFRYLVFDFDRYELLDAARAVYEPAVGRPIRRDRVLLYNAACAVTFLAFRAGHAPEERWCGRTLAEDLEWSTGAIARALPPV